MHITAAAGVLLAALALATGTWSGPARADEPAPPVAPPVLRPAVPSEAPLPPPAADPGPTTAADVWHVQRDGVRMALPLDGISAPVREILRERLVSQGWTIVAASPPAAASGAAGAQPPAPSGPRAAAPPEAPLPQPSVGPGSAAGGDVWHVERDGARMALPVGDISPPVREVLRERLVSQGWAFVTAHAAAEAGPGGGTLAPVRPGTGLGVRPERDPPRGRPRALAPPVAPLRLGGASLLPPEAEGAGWRLASVPTTSLAAAIGLRFGDRILGVDGAAGPVDLRRADRLLRRGGQLGLLVARRDGRLEELQISPAEAAPGPIQPRAPRAARGEPAPVPAEDTPR